MKKIIALALVIFIFMFVFVMGVSATEIDSLATAETTQEATETETTETHESTIKTILNTINWASIIAFATSAGAVIVVVVKKFGSMAILIKSKADQKTILTNIKDVVLDSTKEMCETVKELKTELHNTQNQNAKLQTALSLFIMNSKINPNAKNEIMKYLNGISEFQGNVAEVVEQVQDEIKELDAVEEKVETPALDAIVEQGIVLD